MRLPIRCSAASRSRVDYADIPTAVFSQPEVGTVGLTEAQARAAFAHVDIYKTDFRPIKATLSGSQSRVLMKLVVDGATDRVLGCHIVGPEAAELIQVVGIAVKMKAHQGRFRCHHGAASDRRGRTGDDADAERASCPRSSGIVAAQSCSTSHSAAPRHSVSRCSGRKKPKCPISVAPRGRGDGHDFRLGR